MKHVLFTVLICVCLTPNISGATSMSTDPDTPIIIIGEQTDTTFLSPVRSLNVPFICTYYATQNELTVSFLYSLGDVRVTLVNNNTFEINDYIIPSDCGTQIIPIPTNSSGNRFTIYFTLATGRRFFGSFAE